MNRDMRQEDTLVNWDHKEPNAEYNKPFAEVKDGRKLSEAALTYLMEENTFSLAYYLKLRAQDDPEDFYLKSLRDKKIKMHKEIERFLEQIEIEEKG